MAMATTVAIVPSHHHEAFVFAMTTCVIGVSQHVLLLLFGGKIKVVRSEKGSGIEGSTSRAQATIACLCQRSGDVCVSWEETVKLTV